MRSISPEEAASNYGIATRHDEMDNGEVRFRLEKQDGVAYIRTEASALGGWQQSHSHVTATETYIVQGGWIAHASLIADAANIVLVSAGESVTSPPGMVHNIYMPANSVMHTLKHGNASSGEAVRNEDSERLDEKTRHLSEGQVLKLSTHEKDSIFIKPGKTELYSQDYRHFDTLIWQVPTWSSAIFSLTAVATGAVLSNADSATRIFGVEAKTILAFLLGTVALVLALFWNVLLRFRTHQAGTHFHPGTLIPTRSFFQPGGQECLQLVTALEISLLCAGILLLGGAPAAWALIAALVLLLALVLLSGMAVKSAENAVQQRRAARPHPDRSTPWDS